MAGSASISGLASGMDTAGIISQLMQLEAIPQSRLKTQITTHQSALTKLQDLNTKLAALATKAADLAKTSGWAPLKGTSSYDKVTIATTSGAAAGSLSFSVQSTSKAHVLSSTTTASSLSAVVLTGNKDLKLTIGGVATTINTGGGTLQEVVDSVNNANLGVRATALSLGNGTYGLYVEAKTAGASSTFTLTRANNTTLMGGMAIATQGSDASIKVGGLTVTSPTNTFTNVLPGVNVTLGVDAVAGTNVVATLATDPKAMTESLKGLVDALNGVLSDLDSATATGDSTVKKGPLSGDSRLRAVRDKLVDTLYSDAGGVLSDVGIQLDRTGKFVFDSTKFESAYQANPTATAARFTAATTNTGFADRLATAAKEASNAVDGTITLSINGRKSTIDQLEDSVAAWDGRLELRRTMLTRQFTALETALGRMNSQASWLAGQISSLPTYE